jgi:FkbH-like protein
VVWDLDNTIWHGVLMEGEQVTLRQDVPPVIKGLDDRGILQSIASRSDQAQAMRKLREFGLEEYFLHPQASWGSKVPLIRTIAKSLNIGLDTVAFIDDQPFEREEVSFSLPQVLCIDAAKVDRLLDMPEMTPRFITEDSIKRRLMLIRDIQRQNAEEEFVGPKEAFLASLGMALTIFPAKEEDLRRAEELTIRTNQLNATGYTYSYHELNHFRQSDRFRLLMAKLEDKYGSYGHIGLALVECQSEIWTLKLLLTSCRVMSRGVGSVLLNHIMRLASGQGVRLRAEFVPTGLNRVMEITYGFSGFEETARAGEVVILEHSLQQVPPHPDYLRIQIEDGD